MNEIVAMICCTIILVTMIKAFAGAYSPLHKYDDVFNEDEEQ